MYALSNVRKAAAGLAIAGLLGSLAAGVIPSIAAADAGPTVQLVSTSAQDPSTTNDSTFHVTASIGSSTTDFQASNVSVGNYASVENFSGSGQTYTFDVVPSASLHSDGDSTHKKINVVVNAGQFDSNQQSNTLTFDYAANAPTVDITGGPADGSTVAPAQDAFTFTVDDANATVQCSVVGQDQPDSFYGCGSPQDFSSSLGDGSYRFVVQATNSIGTASSSVNFTVATPSNPNDTDTNVPVISITGPSDGSTVNPADATFTFTVDDTQASTSCSMVEASSSDSFSACTSPQSFTSSSDGSYRFIIEATNNAGTASTTINFAVSSTTAPASSSNNSGSGSGSTQTTSPGAGGGSQPVGSSPTAPSGAGVGNNGSLGTPDSHTVIPTAAGGTSSSGNAVIPTAPVSTTQTTSPSSGATLTSGASTQTTSPSTPAAPVVSQSSGGSALVSSNQPTNTGTVTPGVPNTGSASSSSSTLGASSSLAAAAATSGGGLPGWVWLILAGIVLVGIGIWALRQPA